MADRSISRAGTTSKPSAADLLQLAADVLDPKNVERYATQHGKGYADACVELAGRVGGVIDALSKAQYEWAAKRLRQLACKSGEQS